MLVAVTGATGYIGKKLVKRLLSEGAYVRCLTRGYGCIDFPYQNIELHKFDLINATKYELENFLNDVDVLYHCAGQITDVSTMRALHVTATRNLAEAGCGRIKRWVQLSSVGVYGSISNGVIAEDNKFNPSGEYELTKAESEIIVSEIAARCGYEYTILRPSIVYGAGMPNRSLYRLIDMINCGYFFYIGKPGSTANYIHIENVIDALILCGTVPRASGNSYNVSDSTSIENFIRIIANELNVRSMSIRIPKFIVRNAVRIFNAFSLNFPLTLSRVEALTGRGKYSIRKIEDQLKYHHRISFETGLPELVADWKQDRFK